MDTRRASRRSLSDLNNNLLRSDEKLFLLVGMDAGYFELAVTGEGGAKNSIVKNCYSLSLTRKNALRICQQ
jgi:hypothetical protein